MSKENKENKIQTLHCDKCGSWLKLEYHRFNKIIEGIRIIMPDMPVLICPNCNATYQTDWAKYYFIPWIIRNSNERRTDTFYGTMSKAAQNRYNICKKLNFKYDANDCKCIPGLNLGLTKKGFFTPIFFDRKVLHKYLCFDEYRVDIAGNTYGTIFFPDGNYLSYGINRNRKVFCWLGDIEDKVSEDEQYYLRSYNIESDHDIASEFYAAQLEAEFADYSNEHRLLNSRREFDKCWNNKYSSRIFRHEQDIHEILENLKRPVNWNKEGILPVVNAMNKICIESMRRDSVANAIMKKTSNFDAKNKGSIKLLEELLTVTNSTLDAKSVMKSFFILYDFRVILDHDYTEEEEKEKINFCCQRLHITPNYKNFENLYDELLMQLTESYLKIVNVLKDPD